MALKGWTTIAIPDEIAERIDRVIEAQEHGFRSRADFITEAVKWRLKELDFYQ